MSMKTHLGLGAMLLIAASGCKSMESAQSRAQYVIGYTVMRCDDPRGQFYNARTSRAMIVHADGTGQREIGASLIDRPDTWTQFASWWSERQASVHVSWESEANYLWEREHKTFRMTEGNWLVDACLVDITTGAAKNLTMVERVSNYNVGVRPWPGDPTRATFAPLINEIQHPFVMDSDGRNKRDLSSGQDGFTYGCNVSPDGQRIAYNKSYLVYVAEKDGSNPRRVDEDPAHTFQFIPTWSPDGKWLLFLAGEHHKCHPYLTRSDGTGLRKLADRGTYIGSFELLKHPDFHSAGSDLPVWSPDSHWVYYTAQVGPSVELMRVSIAGQVQQLTHSRPGTEHYYPVVSPDSRLVAFGVRLNGAAALYVADADGRNARPITTSSPDHVPMYPRWRPMGR